MATVPGRRFLALALLSTCLGALPRLSAAANYWMVDQPGVTVVAEGDKETARNIALMTLRMQSAARWLLNWPADYREPPVLIFDVNERLLRRTLQEIPTPPGAFANATSAQGTWERTPALTVVIAPMGYLRGRQLRSFQHNYGAALLDSAPSHNWPACIHQGMSMLFAAAEFSAPNHLFVSGERIVGQEYTWKPEQMLLPIAGPHEPLPQYALDEWGYSCYMLSLLITSATTEERLSLESMLGALGGGKSLEEAVTSELHQTSAEFTARYFEFARRVKNWPDFHNVRLDLPLANEQTAEPRPVSREDVQALLGHLCSKLQRCDR